MPKSRNILPPKVFWKECEEEFLRQNYADSLTVDLAQVLGMTIKRILAKANAMGLRKTTELIAATARERTSRPGHGSHKTRIQPGQAPWNKGTNFVSGGRSAETRFKPGNRPSTWVPVGSYRIVEGNLERKVNDLPGPNTVRWKPVARLVWEAAHGPIPPGHAVVFKPGRKTTDAALITLDALELLTREQLMQRNTIHRYPPEFADLARLKGQLMKAINHRTKKEAA